MPSGCAEDVKPLAEISLCTESDFSDKLPEWPCLLMPHVVIYYLFAGSEHTDERPNGKPSCLSEKQGKLNESVIASDNIDLDTLQTSINSNDGSSWSLQSHCGRDGYGLPDIWSYEGRTFKVGTSCITRICDAAQLLLSEGPFTDEKNKLLWIPWISVQPKLRDGQP